MQVPPRFKPGDALVLRFPVPTSRAARHNGTRVVVEVCKPWTMAKGYVYACKVSEFVWVDVRESHLNEDDTLTEPDEDT